MEQTEDLTSTRTGSLLLLHMRSLSLSLIYLFIFFNHAHTQAHTYILSKAKDGRHKIIKMYLHHNTIKLFLFTTGTFVFRECCKIPGHFTLTDKVKIWVVMIYFNFWKTMTNFYQLSSLLAWSCTSLSENTRQWQWRWCWWWWSLEEISKVLVSALYNDVYHATGLCGVTPGYILNFSSLLLTQPC